MHFMQLMRYLPESIRPESPVEVKFLFFGFRPFSESGQGGQLLYYSSLLLIPIIGLSWARRSGGDRQDQTRDRKVYIVPIDSS